MPKLIDWLIDCLIDWLIAIDWLIVTDVALLLQRYHTVKTNMKRINYMPNVHLAATILYTYIQRMKNKILALFILEYILLWIWL